MSRLTKYLAIPVLAVAFLAVADTSSAKAQGFSLQIGGFGISSGHRHHGHGHRPSFGPSFGGYYGGPGYFHDTSHLHYHAPRLVPHNGHLDYVPGHYDVHRTGHWHH